MNLADKIALRDKLTREIMTEADEARRLWNDSLYVLHSGMEDWGRKKALSIGTSYRKNVTTVQVGHVKADFAYAEEAYSGYLHLNVEKLGLKVEVDASVIVLPAFWAILEALEQAARTEQP